MNLVAYIDGSCFGNPGEAGYGVVLLNEKGAILESRGGYIGPATNNVAEYHGLIGCLRLVQKYKPESLTVFSDSQLLVNQINGTYKIRKPHLQVLHRQIVETVRSLGIRFQIRHIDREQNNAADGLARRAVQSRSDIMEEPMNLSGQDR